jgi:toxin YoeB
LLGLRKYPFIDDSDKEISNNYIENKFYLTKESIEIKCDGFAAAILYDTLAISFFSEPFWDEIEFFINVIPDKNEPYKHSVLHVAKQEHFESIKIKNWNQKKILSNLNNTEDLKRIYPDYEFDINSINDIFYWKNANSDTFSRLQVLLRDIKSHPFTGGLGHTEVLKNAAGICSKHLTHGDRITYKKVEGDRFLIISCKGHY